MALASSNLAGTQLIRRNDELALLYEKIKIQRSAISQGEIAYRERMEDLRVLRLRENAIRRELHIQRSQARTCSTGSTGNTCSTCNTCNTCNTYNTRRRHRSMA